MEPEPHKSPIRFYEIDLLRFLAALSVVFYHYTYRGYAVGRVIPIAFPSLAPFTKYGYLGVELFFIISGYVVLLSAQGKTVQQFFRSRITRLYPAFWVACTATFVVERLWGAGLDSSLAASFGQFLFNMTMLHEFFGITSVDGAYWSLAVEITFYFLVSLLIAYRLMRHINLMLSLWLLYVVAAALSLHVGPLQPAPAFTHLFFPAYAPYFIAGMLFYLLQKAEGRTPFRYGLLAVAYLLALYNELNQAKVLAASYHEPFSPVVVAGAITLFFVVFLLIVFQKVNLNRFTWLKWPGALTYPLYLLHENIGYVLFNRAGSLANKYLLLGGTILTMIGLAYLLHVLVEKPMSKRLGAMVTKLLARLDGVSTTRQLGYTKAPTSKGIGK